MTSVKLSWCHNGLCRLLRSWRSQSLNFLNYISGCAKENSSCEEQNRQTESTSMQSLNTWWLSNMSEPWLMLKRQYLHARATHHLLLDVFTQLNFTFPFKASIRFINNGRKPFIANWLHEALKSWQSPPEAMCWSDVSQRVVRLGQHGLHQLWLVCLVALKWNYAGNLVRRPFL